MENGDYYIISELHLVDASEEFKEDDSVIIMTTDLSVFRGKITDISNRELSIELTGDANGDATIEYSVIESIKKEK